jgi:hypothetical protein
VSLYERYELLDLNRDDGVKTFEARETATGRPVKVHLFVCPAAPLQAALIKAIERLPESARQRIIEQGNHQGTPFLVTDRLVDYPGLSEWVQATSHESKLPPTKPVLATPRPAAPPAVGEQTLNRQFVELFATGERPAVADGLVEQSAPVRVPETVKPAPAEPGEFTRMFQMPRTPALPPRPANTEAGETTKTFQAPSALPSPPPAPAAEPGEFTRMFQAQSPLQPPPQAAAGAGPNRADESTRPLGKVGFDPPPAPPTAAPAPNQPGEFTRMFHLPGTAPAPPPFAPPPAATPIATPRNVVDEPTRQFSAPPQLALGPTSAAAVPSPQVYAPPATAQAPSPPKKSHLALILGVVGLLLVIGLLAVFFLMRAK